MNFHVFTVSCKTFWIILKSIFGTVLKILKKELKMESKAAATAVVESTIIKAKNNLRPNEIRLRNEVEILKHENNNLIDQVSQLQAIVKTYVEQCSIRENKLKDAVKEVTQIINNTNQQKTTVKTCCDVESCQKIAILESKVKEIEQQKELLMTGFKKQKQKIAILEKKVKESEHPGR